MIAHSSHLFFCILTRRTCGTTPRECFDDYPPSPNGRHDASWPRGAEFSLFCFVWFRFMFVWFGLFVQHCSAAIAGWFGSFARLLAALYTSLSSFKCLPYATCAAAWALWLRFVLPRLQKTLWRCKSCLLQVEFWAWQCIASFFSCDFAENHPGVWNAILTYEFICAEFSVQLGILCLGHKV